MGTRRIDPLCNRCIFNNQDADCTCGPIRAKKVRALLFLRQHSGAYRANFRYKRQPADISFHYRDREYGYGIWSWNRVLASCSGWNGRRAEPFTHLDILKQAMGAFVRVFCVCEARYNELGRASKLKF